MTNATIADSRLDNEAPTVEPPPESLDKVRDILFGGQMRAVESRIQGLESRLLQAQDSLKAEFTKQLDALDGTLQKEVQSLAERLGTERAKRTEELKALAADLKESLKNLEQRHLQLEVSSGTADADLREGILQHSKAVSADIARLAERLTTELTRSVQELKAEKASLSALASLFSDMASRLNGPTRD
jgi:predicted  nucleic acid-binding Zn-ribbon protein